MRLIIYQCSECRKEADSPHFLPTGWIQVKFFNMKPYYYDFCGYACLTAWSESRETYYGMKYGERGGEYAEKEETPRL